MTRPLAVRCDGIVDPFATIYAAPRRVPHRLSKFQEQRIGEARHHQSLAASADVHLHCTGILNHLVIFHEWPRLVSRLQTFTSGIRLHRFAQ